MPRPQFAENAVNPVLFVDISGVAI